MTCLGETDRWFVQVRPPGLLESRARDEVERMALPSAVSVES